MKALVGLAILLTLSGCASSMNHYYYHVEKGDQKFTLLGTIHEDIAMSELPAYVRDDLHSARRAFFETEISPDEVAHVDDLDPAELGAKLKEHFVIEKFDPGLDDQLGPDYWKKLRDRLPEFPESELRRMRPQGAIFLLLLALKPAKDELKRGLTLLNPTAMMDIRLEEEVRSRSVPILALDKDREVCQREMAMSGYISLRALLDGATPADLLDKPKQFVAAYRRGDDAKILSLSEAEPFLEECVYGRRNHAWARKLDKLVAPGEKTFVAVGVGHLLPRKNPSLLDRLRKLGFQVTKIER